VGRIVQVKPPNSSGELNQRRCGTTAKLSLVRCARFLLSASCNCRQQRFGRSVVAEGLADVNEAVNVAGSEDEAAAKLEGVLAGAMLAMSGGAGALARMIVFSAK
jgi:hypothetical protein